MDHNTIIFKTGEATVLAREGQFTDAMPEILIGTVDGPVGHAFANMMGQTAGHTRMFAIRACNQQVRPATLMVPKVTMKSMAYVDLFGGTVQAATADAVLDCVIEGILPRDQVNDLCIVSLVWIDPVARPIPISTTRISIAPTTKRPSSPSSARSTTNPASTN